MSSKFGYSQLEEVGEPHPAFEDGSEAGWTATFGDELNTSVLTDPSTDKSSQYESRNQPAKASASQNLPDLSFKYDTSSPKHKANNNPDSGAVKYTPLQFTSVQELGSYEDDVGDGKDTERIIFDSVVEVDVLPGKSSSCMNRFHVAICGLLTAAVAVVAFGLLYVFVILPSVRGKVVFTDGKMHTEDIAQLRKLDKDVIVTSCGLVRGVEEKGGYAFKGIPYANPPTGDRRWAPPEPLSYDTETCWYGIRNASEFGNKCVQPKFDDIGSIEGSEDCLYINVWTPSVDPADNLPVMVWIHSGDLVFGSGNMPGMTPSAQLAYETRAVYVSFNYRLGVFGFLAVDPLRTGPARAAGNYGIMDQQMALKWVQQNIRRFGGNQNMVTIFGHGSGATSIQALLSCPSNTGLFHKAWLTSPVAVLNKTLSEACHDNQEFLLKSGCTEVSCMRSLSALEVSHASPWRMRPHFTLDELINEHGLQLRNGLVIFDGEIVHWATSKEGPVGVDVPVIIGTSYFDMSSLLEERALFNMTWHDFNTLIIHHVQVISIDASLEAKSLYSRLPQLQYTSPAHFPLRASASFARMIGDVKNVCPMKIFADTFADQHSSPVYFYVAELYPSHDMPLSLTEDTTFIGWDTLAFFGGFGEIDFVAGQSDINFQINLREEVMTFVRDGKPNAARWKTVDINSGVISQDVTVRPAESDFFEKCDFWKRHGYFKFTWLV